MHHGARADGLRAKKLQPGVLTHQSMQVCTVRYAAEPPPKSLDVLSLQRLPRKKTLHRRSAVPLPHQGGPAGGGGGDGRPEDGASGRCIGASVRGSLSVSNSVNGAAHSVRLVRICGSPNNDLIVAGIEECSNCELLLGPAESRQCCMREKQQHQQHGSSRGWSQQLNLPRGAPKTEPATTYGEISMAADRMPSRRKSNLALRE